MKKKKFLSRIYFIIFKYVNDGESYEKTDLNMLKGNYQFILQVFTTQFLILSHTNFRACLKAGITGMKSNLTLLHNAVQPAVSACL